MKQRVFIVISCAIFALIFIMHVFRLIYQWDAEIGGLSIPMWASWIALIFSGFLVYSGLMALKQ